MHASIHAVRAGRSNLSSCTRRQAASTKMQLRFVPGDNTGNNQTSALRELLNN
jgi:hypothetical protein